jgi:DNA-binding beta-propeller fold protein YncE
MKTHLISTLSLSAAAMTAALSAFSSVYAQSVTTPAYAVTKSVSLGGPDRWDYVVFDAPSHRVYVAHGDKVTVVDGQDGKILGEVTGIPGGTHGIGISHAAGKGYTDDGKAGTTVAFDLKTLKIVKSIPAKPDADGIAFDPASGHIFVVEGDSKAVQVVDPATDAQVANIEIGSGLEYAVASGDGKLFVNGSQDKALLRIDTRSNTVDARWPIRGCTSPHGLAYDPKTHRAFVSCVNAVLTVVNTDSGAVAATLPIGRGTDAVAFDPRRNLVFSSNGDGTLSIIREVNADHFVSLGSIKTRVGGKTMGIDQDTGRLYIAAADTDPKAVVKDGPDGRFGRPMPLPGTLKLLFLDPVK